MKFTIDTEAKTIIIQEVILIEDLLKELTLLNINYSEYKLLPYIQSYSYPIYPQYTYPNNSNTITSTDPGGIKLRHPDDPDGRYMR